MLTMSASIQSRNYFITQVSDGSLNFLQTHHPQITITSWQKELKLYTDSCGWEYFDPTSEYSTTRKLPSTTTCDKKDAFFRIR